MGEQEGFVDVQKIYDFCQSLGLAPLQVQIALERSRVKKLLEPSPHFADAATAGSYRITTIGAYAAKELIHHFTYVDAMVVDTPIVDEDVRKRIGDSQFIVQRLDRCEIFRDYLDSQWELLAEKNVAFDWKSASEALEAEIERIDVQRARRVSRSATPIKNG